MKKSSKHRVKILKESRQLEEVYDDYGAHSGSGTNLQVPLGYWPRKLKRKKDFKNIEEECIDKRK